MGSLFKPATNPFGHMNHGLFGASQIATHTKEQTAHLAKGVTDHAEKTEYVISWPWHTEKFMNSHSKVDVIQTESTEVDALSTSWTREDPHVQVQVDEKKGKTIIEIC